MKRKILGLAAAVALSVGLAGCASRTAGDTDTADSTRVTEPAGAPGATSTTVGTTAAAPTSSTTGTGVDARREVAYGTTNPQSSGTTTPETSASGTTTPPTDTPYGTTTGPTDTTATTETTDTETQTSAATDDTQTPPAEERETLPATGTAFPAAALGGAMLVGAALLLRR